MRAHACVLVHAHTHVCRRMVLYFSALGGEKLGIYTTELGILYNSSWDFLQKKLARFTIHGA